MTKDKPNYEEELEHTCDFNSGSSGCKACIQEGFQKAKEQYASALQKVKEEIVERFNTDANVVMNWELILNEILNKHFGDLK